MKSFICSLLALPAALSRASFSTPTVFKRYSISEIFGVRLFTPSIDSLHCMEKI